MFLHLLYNDWKGRNACLVGPSSCPWTVQGLDMLMKTDVCCQTVKDRDLDCDAEGRGSTSLCLQISSPARLIQLLHDISHLAPGEFPVVKVNTESGNHQWEDKRSNMKMTWKDPLDCPSLRNVPAYCLSVFSHKSSLATHLWIALPHTSWCVMIVQYLSQFLLPPRDQVTCVMVAVTQRDSHVTSHL